VRIPSREERLVQRAPTRTIAVVRLGACPIGRYCSLLVHFPRLSGAQRPD